MELTKKNINKVIEVAVITTWRMNPKIAPSFDKENTSMQLAKTAYGSFDELIKVLKNDYNNIDDKYIEYAVGLYNYSCSAVLDDLETEGLTKIIEKYQDQIMSGDKKKLRNFTGSLNRLLTKKTDWYNTKTKSMAIPVIRYIINDAEEFIKGQSDIEGGNK